jgi:hexosaminidase
MFSVKSGEGSERTFMTLIEHAGLTRNASINLTLRPISVIPQPHFMERRPGEFRLDASTVIAADEDTRSEALWLSKCLGCATGWSLPVHTGATGNAGSVILSLEPSCAALGPEGYQLRITPECVQIRAAGTAGLFYGGQTLLQLLPSAIFQDTVPQGLDWIIPGVEIEDSPRFRWRGVMLDVARHFLPMTFLEKFVDLLALHKMNVLHLHLNDDQGWRLEIKKYPKLTSVGARRAQTLVGHALKDPSDRDFDPTQQVFDGVPHGGYYTQEEMRGLVEYARTRHIRVVPEIEMPGHAQAAVAAYPEFGCTNTPQEVSGRWGIHTALFRPSEETFGFLEDVLTEVMDVFPSPYIHLGGDEAVKTQWENSEFCHARMKTLDLRDVEELQSYFMRRIGDFLAHRGRRWIGWDEILEGGDLAPNTVVMSWRGEGSARDAARSGYDVVMASEDETYLGHYQSEDHLQEPLAFRSTLLLERVYGYEPVPTGLPHEAVSHILGAQAQIWTEYMPNAAQVEYMAFPRLCALAEVVWSRREDRHYKHFLKRLGAHLERLDALHVRYRRPETG